MKPMTLPRRTSRTVSVAGHLLRYRPGRGYQAGSWHCRRCQDSARHVHAFAGSACSGNAIPQRPGHVSEE